MQKHTVNHEAGNARKGFFILRAWPARKGIIKSVALQSQATIGSIYESYLNNYFDLYKQVSTLMQNTYTKVKQRSRNRLLFRFVFAPKINTRSDSADYKDNH